LFDFFSFTRLLFVQIFGFFCSLVIVVSNHIGNL